MRAARPSAIEPPSLRVAEDTCGPGVAGRGTSYASGHVPPGSVHRRLRCGATRLAARGVRERVERQERRVVEAAGGGDAAELPVARRKDDLGDPAWPRSRTGARAGGLDPHPW